MIRFSSLKFCGRVLNDNELSQIKEICSNCHCIGRTELANTICELFDWKRPTGKLKTVECRQLLEHLEAEGFINLPDRRQSRPQGKKPKVNRTEKVRSPDNVISLPIREMLPLTLSRVTTKEQRELWYEYVDRYHYLGYQLPFGAQVRYFVEDCQKVVVGCLQFSSPAWKMKPREQWIGWNDEQRVCNLQKIINNSRFLIFPWIKVKNLASSILALAIRTVPKDWENSYKCRPVLMETLVDKSRFTGTCYKAANWSYVGSTTGRGRMDRTHAKHGQSPKDIYVYPLTPNFRQELAVT